jgi:hypothetical protein
MDSVVVGSMSDAESAFCGQVRELFRATLDGHTPFVAMAGNLLSDLRAVFDSAGDVNSASAVAASLQAAAIPLTRPMVLSGSQRAFVDDADGFVDFAVRNGFTFLEVASVLGHDLSEIAQSGFDLDKAMSQRFVRPQVTGWAQRNREPVGEREGTLE